MIVHALLDSIMSRSFYFCQTRVLSLHNSVSIIFGGLPLNYRQLFWKIYADRLFSDDILFIFCSEGQKYLYMICKFNMENGRD
ncbi:hypothetical protein SAMN05421881_100253 [Nitrosomonas halophila]|jgi:hypothetical protein|uniref:Uncharacterized protein n=1 Tax=Nitrosomonas halophila TaxID=44576 RepID=A0A1H3C5I7_9PROT|nr:hypothetical protein SAMN05421881_100253 [Nitrosomonas halophila]